MGRWDDGFMVGLLENVEDLGIVVQSPTSMESQDFQPIDLELYTAFEAWGLLSCLW